MNDDNLNWERKFWTTQLWGGVLALLSLSIVWAVLVHFISWTWLLMLANIGFFILTASIGVQIVRTFKLMGLPAAVAWPISLAIWFLVVGVVRSVALTLLEQL